jgi:hypothetical protein
MLHMAQCALRGVARFSVVSCALVLVLITSSRIEAAELRVIRTVAGSGLPGDSGDGGPASAAELLGPISVAVDQHGDLYIAEFFNCTVREVHDGIISTLAGTGR